MIQATDLRIGNWTFMKSQQKYFQIGNGNDIDNCEDLEPIELTEEILLKCGFVKILSDYECAETYDFYNEILYFNMADQSTKINGKYCLGFVPEYLHQLQNLYFALTGKELEINL